jgi:small subunit ribosomal protein S20
MANHKSTKKSIRKTKKETLVNKMRISEIRTYVKKVENAVIAKDKTVASQFFMIAQSKLARGVTKGVLKLNTVSRKISRLSASIKSLG